jgi:hypothetical protein
LINIKNIKGKSVKIKEYMTSPAKNGFGKIDVMGITETGEGIENIDLGDDFVWFGLNKKPPDHKFSGVGAIVIKEIATLKDKRWDVAKAAGSARYKATEAKQKLPQGDPEIAALERTSVTAQKDLEDLDIKIVELQRKQYTLLTGEPAPT